MSSSPEPSCSKQEDTISIYDPSEYDVYDPEELRNESMFEKPRGERRWLGREHHRGKERLHNAVKDIKFIEKTLKSTEPLSKNAIKKLCGSLNDGLELNVKYSLDKKNRWANADTVSLMRATPEDLKTEVVEKNTMEAYRDDKATFAVHRKQVDMQKEHGNFEIRSAKSSGKGQHYSNFLPDSREFSRKANARIIKNQDPEERKDSSPTISYNIYRTHPNQEVVGREFFKTKVVSKSGRHRLNKKVGLEDYEDLEGFEDEEEDVPLEEFSRPEQPVLDLVSCIVGSRNQKSRKFARKEISYELVDALEPAPGYTDLLNIQEYLRDEGSTFEDFEVTMPNLDSGFDDQIELLRQEKKLIVKDLRPHQYLVDVSEWCKLEGGVKDGETTTVIVITHLKKKTFSILINSIIPMNPDNKGLENLIKRLSYVQTLHEAVSKITSDILTNRKIVETMRISSLFYGRKTVSDLLQDPEEWDSQLVNMEFPNQHYHATWANSKELSQVGGMMEWSDLCDMVKVERNMKTGYTSDSRCDFCGLRKRSHELFLMRNETTNKCSDCLREEFYKELRARRVPIDLRTDTADELEYYPTFIPLTIVNLYVRITSEIIYKDLGASGDFEKCPSCKSAVFFEKTSPGNEKRTQNRSCPCGYSWCKHCERVPHWPMKCGDYAEWEEKWLLRYAMTHAQGSGTETLLQITCSCAKQIYNVLLPAEFTECPGCKTNVNMNTMRTVWKHYYYPYDPMLRKYIQKGYYTVGQEYKKSPYVPRAKTYTDIVKIPGIRASVIETCKAARDIRYDVNLRNRAVNREHILIRKGVMEKEVVENLLGTSVYLAENVAAWMYVTNQYDRHIKNTLDSVLEHRKELVKLLEVDDSDAIKDSIKKLNKDIQSVISSVERKIVETSII
ncbi:hypothetical protein B9Z55_018653 [Caenorhabditis nigoni]|uniref:IBR domain-containing protein n=1 Tax=Caenorhabditis nigoni TaxID=1611254 RepID=A0A2G5TF20_9PELO|nr:hypothetical protein B9Z55_018653 [Caenorhabditis nigoni]